MPHLSPIMWWMFPIFLWSMVLLINCSFWWQPKLSFFCEGFHNESKLSSWSWGG